MKDTKSFGSSRKVVAAPAEPGTSSHEHPDEEPKTSMVRYLSYTTKRRAQVAKGEKLEDWEPFGTIGVGTEYTGMAHMFVSAVQVVTCCRAKFKGLDFVQQR
jgi:hypothetical protein